MFNTARLPLPLPEQIRALRQNREAMQLLVTLRRDIAASVSKLDPATLLMLARQHHPGAETDYQAAAALGLEMMSFFRSLAQHSEDMTSLAKAETDRLAPAVEAAVRRALKIPTELEGIEKQLRWLDTDTDAQRDKLRKANVRPEEAERILAQGEAQREARRTELNAQHEALLAEQAALSEFLKSRDERDLPDGFTIVTPPRISGKDVVRQVA